MKTHVLLATVFAVWMLVAGGAAQAGEARVIDDIRAEATVAALVAKHGPAVADRARLGVRQVAMFWRAEDGGPDDFQAFCLAQFVPDADHLAASLARFESAMEALAGHQVALTRALKWPVDVDVGEQLPLDILFASLNPFDHATEDAFRTRAAFVALLNWRLYGGDDLVRQPPADRRGWASARLVQQFAMRVPGGARAEATRAYAEADDYIAAYNVRLDHVLAPDGSRPFPAGLRLISHWGLRDHIKGLYSDPVGNLPAQRLILKVMERIIRQEIPAEAIDSDKVDWDPTVNNVVPTGPEAKGWHASDREPDRRYAELLAVFRAERGVDPYSPAFPSLIARKFGFEREIPEGTVEALMIAILTDPVAKDVAALVRKRLGRKLEPFDIWYDGFKARGQIPEARRDEAVRAKYANLAAFKADVPNVLVRLGFTEDKARYLAGKIEGDPARGAGHAMGAGMRGDDAHLRTRVPAGGMDYKGYNIALHELGHCVEQTFSLYDVDSTLMAGVPNTAFTEAFAFVFQDRDLEVLGLAKSDQRVRALNAIDAYWMTFEIAGVALLDMATWHWMYDHPDATPAQLREAVVARAVELWNRYYAPVLGVKDSPLLAVYSHMISAGLYLPDYPIGHVIQAQIERFIAGKPLGREMERMCVQGRLTPDAWMRGAVGDPVSARALIDAAKAGLKAL